MNPQELRSAKDQHMLIKPILLLNPFKAFYILFVQQFVMFFEK